MAWVPHKDRTAAYYIFDVLYPCSVSNIGGKSIEEISEHGMYSTGNRFLDYQSANQAVQRMLSIDSIYEYFKEGIVVRFQSTEVLKEVYNRITDHLKEWDGYLVHNIAPGNFPAEDMLGLDDLADTLYKMIPEVINARQVESTMDDIFDSIAGFDPTAVEQRIAGIGKPTDTNGKVKPAYPPRKSFADIFRQYLPTDQQLLMLEATKGSISW